MDRLVEIRSYQLKPGAAAGFHRLVCGQVMPLLEAWRTDVVAYGPSAHEADAYFLVRSYPDLAALQAQQDAFYGSPEWRNGPRAAVLEQIESFLNTVLWLSPAGIDSLRRLNPAPAPQPAID
jgi:hypothetical protein